MNKANKKIIDAIVNKRLMVPELLNQIVPKAKWSKEQLIDYIYFLEDQLNDYQES